MMHEKASQSLREAALDLYDSFEWFVLPVDPVTKRPLFAWKQRYGNGKPPREEIAGWPEWDRPEAGLGVRTGAVSGLVVLDVDSEEAHRWIKEKGHPPGPMVQSPRKGGGFHVYLKHPGYHVKSTVGLAGVEGLDIRGDGGIVVVPPTFNQKAKRSYEWLISPHDDAMPDPPPWLGKVFEEQATHRPSLDVGRIMEGIPEGQRDAELNRLAGWMRHKNFPQDVAIDVVEKAAERCKPPFGKAQARSKVVWAFTHYEPGEDFSPILDLSKNGLEGEADTFTLQELMGEEYPPVEWAIDGLLPAGSTIFAGKPKMGKSWMALGFCIAVATGGKALGHFKAKEGDVLYLALEDQKRRLQKRAGELLKSDIPGSEDLGRLHMRVRSKKLDSGLIEQIEEWLKAHPGARLVVIDTLGSVRGRSSEKRTLYEQDYEVGSALTALANRHNVALLIVHHLRKGDADDVVDEISGSTGLTGGLDGAMVLKRTRSASDGIVKVVHRDLEDDLEMALGKVDATEGWWRYLGEAEEYMLGKERREILDILANADGPMKPSQIADSLDKPAKNVSELLRKMLETGHVDTAGYYGAYVAAVAPPPSLDIARSDGTGGSSTIWSRVEDQNLKPNGLGSIASTTSGGVSEEKSLDDLVKEMESEDEDYWGQERFDQ